MRRIIGGPRAARQLGVKVGDGCRIYSLDVASERKLLTIGNRVTISVGVKFITHDGVGWLARDHSGRRYRYAAIEIGDDCFIGAHSIVLPGIRIGDGVIVGAGSVVTKSIPNGLVVAGNPARAVRQTSDLLQHVLAEWPSENCAQGLTGEKRISALLDDSFREELTVPQNLRPTI